MNDLDIERFKEKYEVLDSGCWIWKASKKPDGYGQFWSGKELMLAHKFSLMAKGIEAPEGTKIINLCGHRDCVNWEHWRVADNEAGHFWGHIDIVDDDRSCWIWTGVKNAVGYGQFKNKGQDCRAHRFSWELHYGPIPEGIHVLHTCGNKLCVRPDHLYLGRQEYPGNLKFGDEMVYAIKREYMLRPGASGRSLSEKYGVSQSQVYRFLRGEERPDVVVDENERATEEEWREWRREEMEKRRGVYG